MGGIPRIKVRYITQGLLILIFGIGIILILGIRNISLNIAGIFYLIVSVSGITVVLGLNRFNPVPVKFRKWVMMNVILKVELFFAKIFKLDTDSVMDYFIHLNNRLNPQISGKTLLLLPRCIQNSGCSQDLALDAQNCLRCGNCQIGHILKMTGSRDIEVKLVGGGTLALDKVKEINPKNIIAVACERELVDGIKETLNIPVWAVKNLRPHGPCHNTKININELEKILE